MPSRSTGEPGGVATSSTSAPIASASRRNTGPHWPLLATSTRWPGPATFTTADSMAPMPVEANT